MKKNLILFIHGLSGSQDTWRNEKNEYFGELLERNEKIKKMCDIDYYIYETNKLNPSIINKLNNFRSLFSNNKTKRDLNIKENAKLLNSVINIKYQNYENIFLISHSLGGLISKQVILKDIKKDKKIKLFFSLAVPHNGSQVANVLMDSFTSNITKDLAPLQEFTDSITREWIEERENLPDTYYLNGAHDIVVVPTSSVAYEGRNQKDFEVIDVNEDHTSISKPLNGSLSYLSIKQGILKFLNNDSLSETISKSSFEDDGSYDSMVFFIKLVLGEIVEHTKKVSKESFFKMEILLRNLSPKDQSNLIFLEEKIKNLYDNKFSRFQANSILDSNELIIQLKEEMIDKDDSYLKVSNDLMRHVHKFGYLHHMANRHNQEIKWTREDKELSSEGM